MQTPHPLFYILILGMLFSFASLALRNERLAARLGLSGGTQSGYFKNLEGFRGILALSVFIHHSVNSYFYHTQGSWGNPSPFYVFLGHGPVTLFFFLTGFLFWNKLLNSGGTIEAGKFFLARVKRLVPAYFASILLLLFIVGIRSGFTLKVGLADLASQLAHWFAFGFPRGNFPDINGVESTYLTNAGVAWSLRYEWCFYFAVPLMGWFARKNRWVSLLGTAWLISFVLKFCHPHAAILQVTTRALQDFSVYFVNAFAFGIATAALRKQFDLTRYFTGPKGAILPALGMLIILITNPMLYSVQLSFCLLMIFLPIAYGQDFFGLLQSRVAQFFGIISYDVYLIHGLLLFCMYKYCGPFIDFRNLSQVQVWSLVLALGIVITVLSALMHRYLEMPFMKKKKPTPALPPEKAAIKPMATTQ